MTIKVLINVHLRVRFECFHSYGLFLMEVNFELHLILILEMLKVKVDKFAFYLGK